MICLEAPNYQYDEIRVRGEPRRLFLGGGITGCEEWQIEVLKLLQNTNLIVFNPRRRNFEISPENEFVQITWEHFHLQIADAILFWFSHETVQPIVLFELGKWYQHKPVFVGVHPDYPRKLNVEVQLSLDTKIPIVYTLPDLIGQVKDWSK